jgi:GT2 family glycosyltransferase
MCAVLLSSIHSDEHLPESLADIDLWLKMRRTGYLIVYTPSAKLYQYEMERGQTDMRAEQIVHERWAKVWQGRPLLQSKSFSRTR